MYSKGEQGVIRYTMGLVQLAPLIERKKGAHGLKNRGARTFPIICISDHRTGITRVTR